MSLSLRALFWVAGTKEDLLDMPDGVRSIFGYALYLAQTGGKHDQAKPLKGFGSADVLEVVEDHRGNTYRAVYTVRFRARVYVLHCFQKKSKGGIAKPKHDMDLIRERLKWAERHAKESAK
jgi:phage-related protein